MNTARMHLVVLLVAGLALPPAGLAQTAGAQAFRDSSDSPPAGWTGPVFHMSRNYPSKQPTCEAPWLKRQVSFTNRNPVWDKEWQAYVQDIVKYVREGQDPNLPDNTGWRTRVKGATRWYHVPWMAYDLERGREFVHGLTNELSTPQSEFNKIGRGSGKHTLQTGPDPEGPVFETWSVGMYNPCGAWSIGQGWPATGEPATYTDSAGRMFAKGMPFPEGTVVIKLLNTTADASDVAYLKGSTTWQANGHVQSGPSTYSLCDRAVRKVHLVQIDLAVVDPRSPTRWVYSTLAYDGRLPGKTVLDRVHTLGVEFGNDAFTFPAVPQNESKPTYETILAPLNIPEHYGCAKRLAGVVDQSNSSCVSCHMSAFAPAPAVPPVYGTNIPNPFAFTGLCTDPNTANSQYFSDYKYPQTYPGGGFPSAIPLDSSLQLQVAFTWYAQFKNPASPTKCGVAAAPAGKQTRSSR